MTPLMVDKSKLIKIHMDLAIPKLFSCYVMMKTKIAL